MIKDIISAIREFLSPEINSIKERLNIIDKRLEKMEERIQSIETMQKEQNVKTNTIEIDMRRLEAILGRVEDKINLSERVSRLESAIEDLKGIKK